MRIARRMAARAIQGHGTVGRQWCGEWRNASQRRTAFGKQCPKMFEGSRNAFLPARRSSHFRTGRPPVLAGSEHSMIHVDRTPVSALVLDVTASARVNGRVECR